MKAGDAIDFYPVYPDACELEDCESGMLIDIGGQSYYNGHYNCYTLYLCCEFCGPYDVECV